MSALAVDGPWRQAAIWGGDFCAFNELFEIGLPPAYARAGSRLTLLNGDNVREFTDTELRAMLAGGVIVDGPGLVRLHEAGLAEFAGWDVRDTKEKDTIEVLTGDALNGRFGGWHRDCRPSFYPCTTYLLAPRTPQSRPLAEIVDFSPTGYGPCAGVFENSLGGRVAVLGYYPWRTIKSLAKTAQIKALCRWLSRDTLPAYVSSYHGLALWCRRDRRGRPAFMLLNASLDCAVGVTLHVLGDQAELRCLTVGGRARRVVRSSQDGPYSVFALPTFGPWQPLLCVG